MRNTTNFQNENNYKSPKESIQPASDILYNQTHKTIICGGGVKFDGMPTNCRHLYK